MSDITEERLAGHIELCSLRYDTLTKRFDRLEKIMYGGSGLLFIQLCGFGIFFLGR